MTVPLGTPGWSQAPLPPRWAVGRRELGQSSAVLPSFRKAGSYSLTETPRLDDPNVLRGLLLDYEERVVPRPALEKRRTTSMGGAS